jgi:hypothetical protein
LHWESNHQIFMDTNTSAPHYGQAPSRVSDNFGGSPKTGFSVYGKWQFGDPAVADPTIWHQGLPTAQEASQGSFTCANAGGSPACENVSQGNFPPPPPTAYSHV